MDRKYQNATQIVRYDLFIKLVVCVLQCKIYF